MSICLIDTTVFVEILAVPGKASKYQETIKGLEEKIEAGETLFLPMASILETGNHIAQNGDGRLRRDCAKRFVEHVGQALRGESPFKPINFLEEEQLRSWLEEFPDSAMRGIGLGDLSIIDDWRRLCAINSNRRVYIWSLDEHLKGYCHGEASL